MRFLSSIPARYLVIADQFLFSGMSFVSTLIFAKTFTLSDFGLFSTVILITFLLISLSNALTIQPYQVATIEMRDSKKYLSFITTILALISLIITAITLVLHFAFSITTQNTISIIIMCSGMLWQDFFRKLFLAQSRLKALLISDLLNAVIQAVVLLKLFLLPGEDFNATIFLWALSFIPSIIYSLSIIKPDLSFLCEWKTYNHYQIKNGIWLFLVSFIQWSSANIFIISLGLYINIEALGAFRLIQSLFGFINIIFQSYENYVLPNASRIYSASVNQSKIYLRKTSIQGGIVIAACLGIIFIFSENILELIASGKYVAYAYVVKGMCILYFILFLGYPIRLSIRLTLLNKQFFNGYALSFAFSIICLNYLLQKWQLSGVIAGLIANQLIMLLFWNYQLNKKGFYLWK